MSCRVPPVERVAPRLGRAATYFAFAFLATIGVVSLTAPAGEEPPTPAAPVAPDTPAAPPEAPTDVGTPVVPPSPSLGKTFETPEAAAKALFEAFDKNDDAALKAIMGPGNEDLVQDGSDPTVRTERAELATAAKSHLTLAKQSDGRVVCVVGPLSYPLAIPLVHKDGGWMADTAAGREELLVRRIGEYELEAIGICLAYADAQVQYASMDRNGDGVKEYAQRLVSTPGEKDGLCWESTADEELSPAGPELTPLEAAQKAALDAKAPFGGYYWRILTAQGPHALGGAYSYVINGRMIAGFALLGVPATHRNTGIMSFVVSNQGRVYEKDLGPDSLRVAAKIESFDPDPSWHQIDEATLRTAAATSPEDAPFVEKGSDPESPKDTCPVSDPVNPGRSQPAAPSNAPTESRVPGPQAR